MQGVRFIPFFSNDYMNIGQGRHLYTYVLRTVFVALLVLALVRAVRETAKMLRLLDNIRGGMGTWIPSLL